MSPEHSINPLDRIDQSSDKPKWFAILVMFASILLVTVVASSLLNRWSYLEFSKTGLVIWHSVAFLLLACCFAILVVTRLEQIHEVIDSLEDRITFVRSFILSLSLWATGAFLVFTVVLVVLHLTQGSLRTYRILEGLIPIQSALVLAFIGSTHGRYRAFWSGFAVSLLMGSMGTDVDEHLKYFAESKKTSGPAYQQYKYASGSDSSMGQLPSSIRTDKTFKHLGINYGYRYSSPMLYSQLSTVGWAICTGLLCGGLVACFLSPVPFSSAITKRENAMMSSIGEHPKTDSPSTMRSNPGQLNPS
jgi:hypothetical protein